jgi:hypothetical protein
VLPLFGTWVGTVLAYYFSRENFESAAAGTERLIRQLTPEEKLRSIPVTSVMIKNIFSVRDLTKKVEDVAHQLEEKDIKRLPILQPSGVLHALLYREGLVKYLSGILEADRPNQTLQDLLKDRPDPKNSPPTSANKQRWPMPEGQWKR